VSRHLIGATLFLTFFSVSFEQSGANEVVFASVGSNTKSRVETFGTDLASLGGFNTPGGSYIAADGVGNTFVVPLGGTQIYRHSSSGTYSGLFPPSAYDDGDPITLANIVALGPDGNVYVRQGVTHEIDRFGLDGTLLGVFFPTDLDVRAIEFDSSGTMFVGSDQHAEKFDVNGASLGTVVSLPADTKSQDFAIDSLGNMYFVIPKSLTNTDRIMKFDPTGQLVGSFNPGFSSHSIAVDSHDVLYVGGAIGSLTSLPIVRKFQSDGTPLTGIVPLATSQTLGADAFVLDLDIVNQVPEPGIASLTAAAICATLLVRRRPISQSR
jgi:hypothetical protein